MDKLYYQYTEIVLYWGINGLLSTIIIFAVLIIYEIKNDIEGYHTGIDTFFKEANIYFYFLSFILFSF